MLHRRLLLCVVLLHSNSCLHSNYMTSFPRGITEYSEEERGSLLFFPVFFFLFLPSFTEESRQQLSDMNHCATMLPIDFQNPLVWNCWTHARGKEEGLDMCTDKKAWEYGMGGHDKRVCVCLWRGQAFITHGVVQ